MPRTALALNLVFLLLAVVWRSWVQRRRTGDLGFRGISREAGALERVAVLVLVAGAAGLLVLPALAWAGSTSPLARFDRPAVHGLGLFSVCSGIALTVWAEFQMGDSWRIGVDPSEATSLVTHGPFGYVRNPIYSGMLLAALGLLCLVPSIGSVATGLLLLLGIQLQVRGVEEPYLEQRHGEVYRDYARATGRFVPGIGRFA